MFRLLSRPSDYNCTESRLRRRLSLQNCHCCRWRYLVAVVEGQQREIRLEGMDAPEHGQAFALESQAHLNALVADKDVSLDCTRVGSYNRLICKVLLPGGEDVDLDQIKAGWQYQRQ